MFLIFIFGNSFSQNINLELLDISKNADSNPREFVVINNVYYFIAKGLDLGIELWRSDGTQSGTYIVKDINQGSNGAFLSNESSNLTNVNGLLYFSANDGINGFELWKSDGTELGTVMVKDIASSSSSSSPSDFISLNSEVIFVCDDGINGRELWKTDGTSMGTVLLKDIDSGISGSGPSFLINFNNKVYFQAWNSVSGIELWMTDGTTSNTVIQNDLNPGNSIGVNNLTKMLVFNNELYFRGNSQNTGFELYKTDGSTGNSTLIINLDGNFNNGFVGKMLTSNTTTIFFDGTNFNGKELWKSNGTLVGTSMVKDIYSGYEDGLDYETVFSFIGETLYFNGRNNNGTELWKSDGTSTGTIMVKNIMPGINSSDILYMTTIDDILYFSARQEFVENKNYLWKSDGTAIGTQLVKDVNMRGMSNYVKNKIFKCNNNIFFVGLNDINGWEMWNTDGTPIGTNLFIDINYSSSSFPRKFAQIQDKLLFSAINGESSGHNLFVTDINSNAINLLSIPNGGTNGSLIDNNSYSKFVKFGNEIIFLAPTLTYGYELWKSDGNTNTLLKDIYVGGNGIPENFGNDFGILNNVLYFTANDGNSGLELWRTDGTEIGTYMVKDITTGSSGSNINNFCLFNNKIYFVVNSNQIWSTDGTTAGTNIVTTSYYYIRFLKANSSKLFFLNITSNSSIQLLTNDGTNANSSIMGTWNNSSSYEQSVIFNDILYFVIPETFGVTIYKSDGTVSGTIKLKNGLLLKKVKNLIVCGNYLYITNNYFSIVDDQYNEIWQSDGTSNGTVLTDISQNNNWIGKLECFQNNLFYFYDTYTYVGNYYGYSLNAYKVVKKTNGINLTSHNLNVLNSQQFTNNYTNNYGVYDMFATDSKLYFMANNGYSGFELFSSDSSGLLSADYFESSNQTLSNKNNILYPNPADLDININSLYIINKVLIVDISGKNIREFLTNKKQEKIDISNINSGIYIVKVFTDGGVFFNKLIKK